MAPNSNSYLQKSKEPLLTQSSWTKIIVILSVTVLVLINMWSCMSDSTAHYHTASTTVERADSEIPQSYGGSNTLEQAESVAVASPMTTSPDGTSVSWTFPASSLEAISTTWGAGSLDIHALPDSEGDTIHVAYTSENNDNLDHAPRVELIDGTLEVESASTPMDFLPLLFTDLSKTHLEIGIPESVAHNLSSIYSEAASGTLNYTGLTTQEAQFELASGNLNLNSFNTDTLSLDIASGVTSIDGQIVDWLDANVASGKLTAKSTECPTTIDISLMSGTIDLTVPKYSVLETDIDKVSGSFENQLPTNKLEGSPTSYLTADITSGSVVVKPLEGE